MAPKIKVNGPLWLALPAALFLIAAVLGTQVWIVMLIIGGIHGSSHLSSLVEYASHEERYPPTTPRPPST